jgi:hypothetical protein
MTKQKIFSNIKAIKFLWKSGATGETDVTGWTSRQKTRFLNKTLLRTDLKELTFVFDPDMIYPEL